MTDITEPAGAQAATPTTEKRARKKHRIIVSILLIIGTILTPITIIALFVHTEISDTGRYVQNVSPLASNAAIQTYVADQVSTRLLAQVDVDAYVKDALPPRAAQKLAGPISSAFEGFVHQAVLRVVQSKQFQTLWDDANRVAHTQIDAVLTGSHNSAIVHDPNGTVSIDLSKVVAQVVQRLQSTGIDLFSKIPIVKVGGQIPIFQSKDLYQIRKAVGLFNKIAYLLPFLVLACFGGAVWLSKNRRKGFLAAAICFGLGALIVGLSLTVGRHFYLNATSSSLPEDAAAAVFDTLVRFLRVSVRAALLFSVIVVVAVFFSGPSKAAAAFRRSVQRAANWLGTQTDEAGWGWLGSHAFFVKYKRPMRIIVTVGGFAVLFRWKHPTPMVILWTGVIVLVLLALIEFFGRERQPAANEPAPLQTQHA